MIEATFEGERKRTEVCGLTQWDYGRTLIVEGIEPEPNELFEFHFAEEGAREALRCAGEIRDGCVESVIPAELLETGRDINAYLYRTDPGKGMTIYTVYMPVKKRPKPEDYDAPSDKNIIQQIREELEKKADGIKLTEAGLILTSGGDQVGEPVDLQGEGIEPIPNEEIDEIMKGENHGKQIS